MGWQWKQVREHYRERMRAAKRNQKHIAAAGGIQQSSVSKLLHNRHLGPSVEIFLNAVEGLGIPVSEFFRQLERARDESTTIHARDIDVVFIAPDQDARDLARTLQRIIDQRVALALKRQGGRPRAKR